MGVAGGDGGHGAACGKRFARDGGGEAGERETRGDRRGRCGAYEMLQKART